MMQGLIHLLAFGYVAVNASIAGESALGVEKRYAAGLQYHLMTVLV